MQAPFCFWDLLGFTRDGAVKAFQRRRAAEIEHGRISTLGTMGYIASEVTGKFPGYPSYTGKLEFADIPNDLAAISKVFDLAGSKSSPPA